MNRLIITATVSLERNLFVVIFERNDNEGYTVAREIFGKEPTDPEIYEFISKNYFKLSFSEPIEDFELVIKRKNFKRMQRDVKKELSRQGENIPISRSQEVLKAELEKNKKIAKKKSSQQKLEEVQMKFTMKQEKKKQKHRGH